MRATSGIAVLDISCLNTGVQAHGALKITSKDGLTRIEHEGGLIGFKLASSILVPG